MFKKASVTKIKEKLNKDSIITNIFGKKRELTAVVETCNGNWEVWIKGVSFGEMNDYRNATNKLEQLLRIDGRQVN